MKIFTSGKMTGLSRIQATRWRLNFEIKACEIIGSGVVKFVHPSVFFDTTSDDQSLAREWEINQIMDSDIVVVDLSHISDSIGTHMELGIVEGLSRVRDKKIWVIGIGEQDTEHPWIDAAVDAKFESVDKAAMFIRDYLTV